MGSKAAEQVAKEVIKAVESGGKAHITTIAPRGGRYSIKTAISGKIQKTKSYLKITQPIVNRWIKERERITNELESKDLTKVQYQELVKSLDIITKNIQLLTGGATENIAVGVKKLPDQELVKLADLE